MRAKDNGFAVTRRFEHIMATLRHERPSHINGCRVLKDCRQFPNAVQEKNGRFRGKAMINRQLRTPHHRKVSLFDKLSYRIKPVCVTWRDKQFEVWMIPQQKLQRIEHYFV